MSTATTSQENKAIAKPPSKMAVLKGWLESDEFKNAIARALPKHMTAERFIRVAITATMKTPKLLNCTQESVFNCLLALSQYGLEPDGRRAHLIPFDVKKKQGNTWVVDRTDCTLIIDFKGYAELVMRSGLVSGIHADVICENDEFEYDRGQIVKHKIDFRKPRGLPYAAYAEIRLKDGEKMSCVMAKDDIYAIRNRSQGWIAFQNGWAKQSPWNPAEPIIEYEMWKKTTFRRLQKWFPISPEILAAIEHEDHEERRLSNVIEAERATITDQTSKSDMIADMLSRQSNDDMDQSDNRDEEMSGEELREHLEIAKAATEERYKESVPVAKQSTKKPASDKVKMSMFNALSADLKKSKDADELQRLMDDISEAIQSGSVSQDEGDALIQHYNSRMEIMNPK